MPRQPRPPRVFGHIEGHPEGSEFESRRALAKHRIHPPLQAGISGSAQEGADSIVLSGGYQDDQDFGDFIVYTGHGGLDSNGNQVRDQEWTGQNKALVKSHDEGMPVRVSRKTELGTYVYGGLFRIDGYWRTVGLSGFRVCQFAMTKIHSAVVPGPSTIEGMLEADLQVQPKRVATLIQRLVRDTAVSSSIKKLHDYRCQICDVQLPTRAGLYAEGAHIRPLGSPHNGSDSRGNILCLCPNHHVLFDRGAIYITTDFMVVDTFTGDHLGELRRHSRHTVGPKDLAYHRDMIAKPTS